MSTVTIHYRPPKGDPFKIPRPHRLEVGEDGVQQMLPSGEIGPLGGLLGFTRTLELDFYDKTRWRHVSQIDDDTQFAELAGWYPCFTDLSGIPFTYKAKVDRIEVTP